MRYHDAMDDMASIDALLEHAHLRTLDTDRIVFAPGERRTGTAPANMVCLIDRGSVTVTAHGSTLRAKASDIVILPMDTAYDAFSRSGASLRMIRFTIFISDFRAVAFRLLAPSLRRAFLREPEGISLAHAFERYQKKAVFSRAALNGALALIISYAVDLKRFSRSTDADARAMRIFAPVLDLIRRRYREALTVSALSAASGLTTSYFCSYFKKTFGVSPLQYVQRVRLFSSQHMLRDGGYSIKETAAKLGFSDQAVFSRAFKRHFKVSPSAMRSSTGTARKKR